jgi:transposase
MALLYRRCAGLDVHRDSVAACIRIRANGKYEEQRETFGTFTADLKRLARWLKDHRVRQVAMESTGVYWIPVWNILESSKYRFELTLVNPTQVRALAGHKTDQIDCGRISEFLQHGRLAGSFIPPPAIREARALERRRVHLQQDRNRVINRIGRLMQTVNIKLSSVISNIVGLSGLRILRAIARGQSNGAKLAELAHARMSGKKELLIASLDGCYSEHFRYLLGELLEELDHLTAKVDEVTSRLALYMAAPGIDKLTAWTILAEIGTDLSPFPDAKHLASWAALCPGNNESAGKRKQGRTRKGNRYLRRVLVQAAWAAGHSKGTFLSSLFFRFARRQGMKKAAVSVAHRMLLILYPIIRDGASYQDRGDDYFDRLNPVKTAHRLISRLERLGYDTTGVAARPDSPAPAHAAPDGKRRGRPCKCAERGLPCPHRNAGYPLPAPAAEPLQRRPLSSLQLEVRRAAAIPPGYECGMCADARIPCIHIRPKLRPIKPQPGTSEIE